MKFVRSYNLSIATVFLVVIGLTSYANAQQVEQTNPPVRGFFAKLVNCEGIPVRSSAAVEDNALQMACAKIATMLKNIPATHQTLIQKGSELHIIGRNEETSDLPEFRNQRGKQYTDNHGHLTTIDERTRGKGGFYASCGEENILGLSGDRYHGEDVCVHEFAHTIMDTGFTDAQREQIKDQYTRSMAKGLWVGSYAATNAKEFWAELSMWYFGGHGAKKMTGPAPQDGWQGLQAYDPDAFSLLHRLYNDQ